MERSENGVRNAFKNGVRNKKKLHAHIHYRLYNIHDTQLHIHRDFVLHKVFTKTETFTC